MISNIEYIKDKLDKNVIFFKRDKSERTRYILAVTHFYCEGCGTYHKIKFGDTLANPEIQVVFSHLGFDCIGESDFTLKYVASEGYRKDDGNGIDKIGEEWGNFIKKFKYDVYIAPNIDI